MLPDRLVGAHILPLDHIDLGDVFNITHYIA